MIFSTLLVDFFFCDSKGVDYIFHIMEYFILETVLVIHTDAIQYSHES